MKFKLKKNFKNKIISKRIEGRMITFNVDDTSEDRYEFYYNIGFKECFTIIKEKKVVEIKNVISDIEEDKDK